MSQGFQKLPRARIVPGEYNAFLLVDCHLAIRSSSGSVSAGKRGDRLRDDEKRGGCHALTYFLLQKPQTLSLPIQL